MFSSGTVTLPTAGQPSRESRAQNSASPGWRLLTWEGGRWGLGKQATLLGAELRMRVSRVLRLAANSWEPWTSPNSTTTPHPSSWTTITGTCITLHPPCRQPSGLCSQNLPYGNSLLSCLGKPCGCQSPTPPRHTQSMLSSPLRLLQGGWGGRLLQSSLPQVLDSRLGELCISPPSPNPMPS